MVSINILLSFRNSPEKCYNWFNILFGLQTVDCEKLSDTSSKPLLNGEYAINVGVERGQKGGG